MQTVTIQDVDLAIKRQRIFKEAKKNLEWYEEELEKVNFNNCMVRHDPDEPTLLEKVEALNV